VDPKGNGEREAFEKKEKHQINTLATLIIFRT
jgi:hypothetical protein